MVHLFNTSMIIGLALLLFGVIRILFPPAFGNLLYGFSTRATLKNEENWKKGQRMTAFACLLIGMIFAVTGAILYYFQFRMRILILLVSYMLFWVLTRMIINNKLEGNH